MKISIGNDHAGVKLKRAIKNHLEMKGHLQRAAKEQSKPESNQFSIRIQLQIRCLFQL